MHPIWAAGLMTGTVLDGDVDVALLRTDGQTILEHGPAMMVSYPQHINTMLAQCLEQAANWGFTGPEPPLFSMAERELTLAQAGAVQKLLQQADMAPTDIAVIGFHGQSVLHRAPTACRKGKTRQLGDGALMARELGIPVAFDFRSADMEAGGQGAPLCTIYHQLLLDEIGAGPETAILNLGGVANISWRDGEGKLIGFDTGPASAPLNDWVRQHGQGSMDRDGRLALSGRVDEALLARLLRHPYLDLPCPKSLDRNDFTARMAAGLSLVDGAALMTAFSAACVGRGLDLLPTRPERLIVCGGGRRNPAMMAEIERRAAVHVIDVDTLGWDGDVTEAACFALLAVRTLYRLPISFPGTTGVAAPITGGRIARP